MTARYALRALGGPVLYNPDPTYMVLISGKPVFVQAQSLSIQRSIGRISQASLTVRTEVPTHFRDHEQIKIYDQNTYLAFSGYIDTPKEQQETYQDPLIHTLACVDQHWLAQKRTFTGYFENQSCGYIAYQIWLQVLQYEGVTIGQIYDGVIPSDYLYPSDTLYPGGAVGVIPTANFHRARCSDALDALAAAANESGVPFYWSIDQFKRFWFVPYTAITNSTVIDGDGMENPPIITWHNPKYANMQILTGGVQETVTQHESAKGDGNKTTFPMGYPLSRVPTMKVNGVSKTVGIQGVDSGKDWYWNKGSNIISQDSSGVKLTSSDVLSVDYIGQYPTDVVAQDDGQIAYQASVDGTSGIVENAQEDTSVSSVGDGLSKVSQLLTRYAVQGVILEFTTLLSGLDAGQLVSVDLPANNLSGQTLIESVTASDSVDGINIRYNIKAVQGPYDTTWEDFFSRWVARPQQPDAINVGTSQAITSLQQMSVAVNISTDMTAEVYSCPIPSNTLYPRNDLYPC